MQNILLHPQYFGSIAQFTAIAQGDAIVFENEDNYQKQTYRNRTYIYGANGRLLLSVPIKHTGKEGERKRYKDIQIENDFPWQSLHWKSLETAYRTSPFFEYYEDEFAPLFTTKKKFLLDFNYECLQAVLECLQLDINYSKTESYQKEPINQTDLRTLTIAKKERDYTFESYIQVFSEKHGFIPNLSILDLIFNEGTNALTYLENQSLD